MKKLISILTIVFTCLLIEKNLYAAEETTLKLICYADVTSDYLKFIDEKGLPPTEITDFSGRYSRRDVVEIILMQQALVLGGFDKPVVPISLNDTRDLPYLRSIELVKRGYYIAHCNSVWKQDAISANKKHDLLLGPTVIPANKFVAGLYTKTSNLNNISIKNLDDFRKYTTACVTLWRRDYETLMDMGGNCIDVTSYESMIAMVNTGRADLMLSPFQSTENMVFQPKNLHFSPIPNIKVKLNDDRVFIVSAKHSNSQAFSEALHKGLAKLKQQGTIERAYTQAGFYHPAIKNWTLLNP